jgi:hypothetical protein
VANFALAKEFVTVLIILAIATMLQLEMHVKFQSLLLPRLAKDTTLLTVLTVSSTAMPTNSIAVGVPKTPTIPSLLSPKELALRFAMTPLQLALSFLLLFPLLAPINVQETECAKTLVFPPREVIVLLLKM